MVTKESIPNLNKHKTSYTLKTKIKILHLEDIPTDAELVERELKKGNIQFDKLVVDNKIKFEKALTEFAPDIIISDHTLPSFDSFEAIKILKQKGLTIPVILVTATVSDEYAVEIMKAGAIDYILKDRLNRLPQAIENAMEKNRAEQKLRESETFHKAIFSSLSTHIAVIDQSGTLIAVNKAWDDYGNENRKTSLLNALIGNNYFDVCKQAIENGDRDAEAALAGIQCVLNKEERYFEMEYPCHSPGQQQWFKLSVENLGTDTNKVVISHQDITERKIAENKLNNTSAVLQKTLSELNKILDSSLDVICSINGNGEFVNVSAASQNVWGYAPDDLVGTKFMNLVYHEDVEVTNEISKTIESGIQIIAFENRYVHKSGKLVPILWSANWDEKLQLMFCIAKDVTEKKRLEKAVNTERDQFFEMFSKAPASIGLLKGANHVFEMANPLYLEFIGKKNVIGKTVAEVIPEVIEQGFISILDTVYSTGKTFIGAETLVEIDKKGNGELADFYMNFIFQAYRNSKGEIKGVFFFINDITEQILSRKEIEKSEKQYRQIVETTQEGIWQLDENNKIIFVNNKICEILEYSEEEMFGKEPFFFMDESGREKFLMALKRRKKGISENYKLGFISKNGKHILTNISANPIFDNSGNYKGTLGMVSDITDKKKLEALLDKSNRLARIGSWEIDVEKKTVFWSNITKEIREAEPGFIPDLSIGLGSFKEGADRKTISQRVQQCIDKGIPWDEELQLTTFKGNLKWVRTIGEAEFVQGKCSKVYGSLQDITERKIAEIERVKMISDMVQRNSDLEQFSYIVSHNLRAPTANIIGFAEILQDDTNTPQEQKELLQGISASVTGLDTIIKDMNSILQSKREVHEKKEIIVFSKLVNNIMISIGHLIYKHHVRIKRDFSEIDEIYSLKIYIHSIFYNLISNSIKYSKPNERPLIEIKSKKENGKLVLTFKDNGLGIDMTTKSDKVFGLYNRFHSHVEGKGMGLFMVKTQVESLGGRISVASEPNKGTEFTIEFEI